MFGFESGNVPVCGALHDSAHTVQEGEYRGGLFVFAPCHVKFYFDLRLTQPDGHQIDTGNRMIRGCAYASRIALPAATISAPASSSSTWVTVRCDLKPCLLYKPSILS